MCNDPGPYDSGPYTFGAKSHRSTVSQPQARKILREFTHGNIGQDDERLGHRDERLGHRDRCDPGVAIRSVIFSPAIRRRSYVIIGFVAPAIGPNKSKKLTRLISPTHNIRGKVCMKNNIHGFTDNVTSGMSLRR